MRAIAGNSLVVLSLCASVGVRTRALRVARPSLVLGLYRGLKPHRPREAFRHRCNRRMGLRCCDCFVVIPSGVPAGMVKDRASECVHHRSPVHRSIGAEAQRNIRLAFLRANCGPLLDYFSVCCVIVNKYSVRL